MKEFKGKAMKRGIEIKIGDSITHGGITYVCKEDHSGSRCQDCDLYLKPICDEIICSSPRREDKKYVIFEFEKIRKNNNKI